MCRLHDPEAASCFLLCGLPFCKNVKCGRGAQGLEGTGQWVPRQQLMSPGERKSSQGENEEWAQQSSMLHVPFKAPSNVGSGMGTWGG